MLVQPYNPMAIANLSLKRLNSQFSCLQKLVKRGLNVLVFTILAQLLWLYANTCFVLTPTETVLTK